MAWGVHIRLDRELLRLPGAWRRVPVERLEVTGEGETLRYAREFSLWRRLRFRWHNAIGRFEEWMGRYSFATFFGVAYLVAFSVNRIMDFVFPRSEWFSAWFFRWSAITIPATVLAEFGLLAYLFAVRIPTWIDNSYKRLNRADNLMSLRRVRS